jgi:hypothetical protein
MRKRDPNLFREQEFDEILRLIDSPAAHRWALPFRPSPELRQLLSRLGYPPLLEDLARDLNERVFDLMYRHTLWKRLVKKQRVPPTAYPPGDVLPPFNFWTPGWDRRHLFAAEHVVVPMYRIYRSLNTELFCMIHFRCRIADLMSAVVRKRDFQALLKLVKLEPLFIAESWAAPCLKEAFFFHSRQAASQIEAALGPDTSFFRPSLKVKTLFAAWMLIRLNYPHAYPEMYQFLKSKNVMHYDSEKSFQNACENAQIKKPYPKKREWPDSMKKSGKRVRKRR